ncbi:GntR family transcriptional regulator [Arthrobacter sp. 18067]|uniref:GntR family transcriptional regulator n=1 Tax=Arthrobacter sp. 18067 TaxID=2681413 RepID=UPI001357273E|nr:GntR family transcriptional regulator [Arthrobacter sp. 18067]
MITWKEQLAFAPLEAADRGEEVGRRLRHAIELGVLEDGSQLPSESYLASVMGVSTLTLRSALAELRGLGLVETRRGKGGGSFVKANTGDITRMQRQSLASYSLEDLRDLREYRAFLAGAAAAASANQSHRLSMGRLAHTSVEIRACERPADAIRSDSKFHIELAASSGSVRLTRQEIALQAEVGPLVWADPADHRDAAAEEHAHIVEAIRAGDAALARELAEEHVRGDMNLVIDQRMELEGISTGSPTPTTIDDAVAAIESLAATFHGTAAASMREVEKEVRAGIASAAGKDQLDSDIYGAARRAVAIGVPLLYGTGFVADESYFGESWMAWCYTPVAPESPQRLYIDIDLYDFATAPWRPDDPGEDSHVHTSHAYVDASGTNENVVTFSKRVVIAGDYVGTLGADVRVGQLQSAFEPLLGQLPPNTSIVDNHGTVIATNTGRFLGGTIKASDPVERRALPAVPWVLCMGGTGE